MKKVKDIFETIFYCSIAGLFIFGLPILLIYTHQFIRFGIIYIPILLLIVVGCIGLLKEKKYKKKNTTESVIEDTKLGKVNVITDSIQNNFTFNMDEENVLFRKYNPEIKFENYKEDSKEIYLDILGYIKDRQDVIEQKLKNFYLSEEYQLQEKEVEENFTIEVMTTKTYEQLTSYVKDIEENGFTVEGVEELKNLLDHSWKSDIFVTIGAECKCLTEVYATSYINCRTKEICYVSEDMN